MPPPKKPKTGVTKLEDYLTEDELRIPKKYDLTPDNAAGENAPPSDQTQHSNQKPLPKGWNSNTPENMSRPEIDKRKTPCEDMEIEPKLSRLYHLSTVADQYGEKLMYQSRIPPVTINPDTAPGPNSHIASLLRDSDDDNAVINGPSPPVIVAEEMGGFSRENVGPPAWLRPITEFASEKLLMALVRNTQTPMQVVQRGSGQVAHCNSSSMVKTLVPEQATVDMRNSSLIMTTIDNNGRRQEIKPSGHEVCIDAHAKCLKTYNRESSPTSVIPSSSAIQPKHNACIVSSSSTPKSYSEQMRMDNMTYSQTPTSWCSAEQGISQPRPTAISAMPSYNVHTHKDVSWSGHTSRVNDRHVDLTTPPKIGLGHHQSLPYPEEPLTTKLTHNTRVTEQATCFNEVLVHTQISKSMPESRNTESQSSPDNGSIGGTPPFTPDVDLTAPPSPTDSLTPRYAMLPESPCLPSSSVGHTDNYMCAQSPGVSTSSSYEITSSTMVDDKSLVKKCINSSGGEIRRCQICNDTASGFHYGVWSCEGCKAFFKRSLQGPVEYVCPATNNCTIDKHRRKSCQACRLRKCLERGMTRGNPRKEKGCRAPRQMKRKAQMLQEDLEEKEKMSRSGDDLSVDEFTIPISGYHPNESETLVSANNMTGSSPPPIENSVPQDKGMDMPPIHPLVEHLMSIDPPVRFSNHDTTLPDTEVSLFTSLLKLADSELLDVINWAKSLPGYMDLKLQERIKVLEACWLEVLILGLMWRSMPHQDVLAFAPDLHFGRERFITPRLQSTLEKNLSLAAMMRQYKVNREEMVLLRMTILLNAGAIMNLDCKDKLQSIQDQVHEAMVYTLVTRYRVGYNRMSQLLLILPHIKQVAMEGFQTISEIMSEKNVPIMNLLREVIDGQFSLKKELTSIEPPYASKTSHPSPHKESSDSNVNMSQSLQAGKNDSIQNMFQ